jgi:hypothetical protein
MRRSIGCRALSRTDVLVALDVIEPWPPLVMFDAVEIEFAEIPAGICAWRPPARGVGPAVPYGASRQLRLPSTHAPLTRVVPATPGWA